MITPRVLLLACLFALGGALGGCATKPAGDAGDFAGMGAPDDRQASQAAAGQYPRYADERLQAYVQQVGERIARASDRPNPQNHFIVIDSPELDAFALPGGDIGVDRGLLAYLNSEAELAAVLGAALLRGGDHGVQQGDDLGARYLARAGYDPTAIARVVRVLKNQQDYARQVALQAGRAPRPTNPGLFAGRPSAPAQAPTGGQSEVGRERYLHAIDGLAFGDSAASGIRRGQSFYHGELGFTLSVPAGWGMLNRPSALIAYPRDRQAYIGMKLMPRDDRLGPADFLRKNAGGRLDAEQTFQQAGLDGATAVLPGLPARRVAVIYQGRAAYLFVGVTKGRASLDSRDADFLGVIHSFRPLRADERQLAEPRRLALVRVPPGQSLEQLAQGGNGLESDAIYRIRLLNDLYPTAQPKAGDWLKIVR